MKTLKLTVLALLIAVLTFACISCGGGNPPPEGNGFYLGYNCYGVVLESYGSFGRMDDDDADYVRDTFFENSPGQIEIKAGDVFKSISVPTVEGYKFLGWYERDDNGEYTLWEDGMPLPTDRHINVEAVYEKIRYNINIYANGEFVKSEEYEGVTQLLNANVADPEHIYGDDYYYQQGITLVGNMAGTYDLAEVLNAKGDFNYNYEYFYWAEVYTDPEMTIPLTTLTVTEEISLYEKYVYAPIRFNYFEDGTCVIIGVENQDYDNLPDGVLEIPAKMNNLTVTGVDENAFANGNITELIIHPGVKTIGENAFGGSTLEKIYIPASIESIGSGAFAYCYSLSDIEMYTTCEVDLGSIFDGCESLDPADYEYYGALYIGYYFVDAIYGYTGHVKIKPGCISIPEGAFEGATIEELTIPASLKTIGKGAFKNSTLVRVNIEAGITTLPAEIFEGTLITAVTIPNTVTEIGDRAFKGAPIASLTIPASVTSIGAEAFAGAKITDITIPATVTTLGKGVFKNCELLVSCTVNTTAEFKFSQLFENCTSLTGEIYGNAYYYGNEFIRPINKDITWAVIKPGCTEVPANAFRDCTKLSKVYLPKSVKNVGTHAFYNVNSLYFACYIEAMSYTKILWGENALATVHPETGDPMYYVGKDFPTSIFLADNGIAYAIEPMTAYTGRNDNAVVVYGLFNDATDVTVDATYMNMPVKVIYPNAFMDNTTLQTLTVGACEVVGSAAFWNASALKEVTFGSCSLIGIRAFYGCESLETVKIESNLMFIGMQAFEGCDALSELKANNALVAWSTDLSETEDIAASTNIASALKGEKLYWFFASTDVTQSSIQALIDRLNNISA